MINPENQYVEWALLHAELEEAHEHLGQLLELVGARNPIDEGDFAVDIGHVFAHLNRAWNARAHVGEIDQHLFERFSKFPTDLEPVG